MSSSSIIAHRMRSSTISEDGAPSVSSFIDGLSPHPSVHNPSFLSSSPPPMISGLERHPDAPRSFSSSMFFEPIVEDVFWGQSGESRLDAWSSSRYSQSPEGSQLSASSRFLRSGASTDGWNVANLEPHQEQDLEDEAEPSFDVGSSPNPSTLSTSSTDTSSSDDSFENHQSEFGFRCTSPFADPIVEADENEEELISLSEEPAFESKAPSAACSSFVNPFADFSTSATNSRLSKWMPSYMGSPISPSGKSLSRILMEYFRGIDA